MSTNPLFPPSDKPAEATNDPAVALIRSKVSRAYSEEPNAVQELAEVQSTQRLLSKHQRYMQTLSGSGKSLAEIQTAWHKYYITLSDPEKHEVWQEFYAANQHTPYQKLFQKQQPIGRSPLVPAPANFRPTPAENGVVVADHTPAIPKPQKKPIFDGPVVQQIKQKLSSTISANGQLTIKHHLQSLGFGLASGMVVLILFLFTFFNEYIIAPFIQPSRNVSSTPIILTSNTVAADAPPSVTIPKINIQIPLNFSVTSYNEADVENGLKGGVVHYPNTVMPGQNGNGAYFGHSSGNIFNNGKYKFAFTLLHDLTTGDIFYITYGGKTYAYQIFAREIVPPSDVGVINDTQGKQATATLITCDPPGISTNRLVLWGEQISPSPNTNAAAPAATVSGQPTQLADNGPSLWNRFVGWAEFWN
ncbi:MAG TPA: sortase [Candidatus Saccharimonadia bacterium]|nr:sortase [Candidatus Saccharimonadia bacterium]